MVESLKIRSMKNTGSEHESETLINLSREVDGIWRGGTTLPADVFYAMCKQVAKQGSVAEGEELTITG